MTVTNHEALLNYLDHASCGVTELVFEPSGEDDVHVGYFDDLTAVVDTVDDYQGRGLLKVGVQPRPRAFLERAENRLYRNVPAAKPEDITHFLTAVVNVFLADDGTRDSSSIAMRIAGAAAIRPMVTVRDNGSCDLIIAVPCITVQDRADLEDQLRRYGRDVHTHIGVAGTSITVDKDLADSYITLNGLQALQLTPRAESVKLGRRLHRTLPPKVMELLNRTPNGRLAKLFRSEGAPGVDNLGNPLPSTPEVYDLAFVKQLIHQGRRLSRDDLVDALWNRPGCAAKTVNASTVYDVVDAALDDAREVEPPAPDPAHAMSAAVDGPPEMTVPFYPPDVSLRDRLNGDYRRWSDRAEAFVLRVDIDITHKAAKVINFLMQQGAEFYHFEATGEVLFVINNRQHGITTKDRHYRSWFNKHVKIFTSTSKDGRELTDALREAVLAHDATIHSKSNQWGHFDRETGTLYFCFDPGHAVIIRVRPGIEGVPVVEELPNGADGITLRGPTGRPGRFNYRQGSYVTGLKFFRDHIHRGQALPELDRLLSTMFNMATLIPDHTQRPMKFHQGAAGSGKTYAAYDWEVVVYGAKYGRDYDDVPTFLKALKEGGPFVTFDNAEANVRYRFRKHYLPASTGSAATRRELYTTDDTKVYEPNGTICFTAIEGMSKEEEVRRTFEFNFSDTYHTDRADPTTRFQALCKNSDYMLSAVLEIISLKVLPNWAARYASAVTYVTHECPRTSKKAFSDYLAWMLMFTESVGQYLWEQSRDFDRRKFDARALFHAYMADMAEHDMSARVTGDPVMSCLESLRYQAVAAISQQGTNYNEETIQVYINEVRVARLPDGTVIVGPVTTSALCRCFNRIAKDTGLNMPYRDGRVLGHRMAGLADDPAFGAVGWSRELIGKGHKNTNKYQLTWTPTEPYTQPDVDLAPPEDAGAAE